MQYEKILQNFEKCIHFTKEKKSSLLLKIFLTLRSDIVKNVHVVNLDGCFSKLVLYFLNGVYLKHVNGVYHDMFGIRNEELSICVNYRTSRMCRHFVVQHEKKLFRFNDVT